MIGARKFKIVDVNEGHCQITYRTIGDFGEVFYFCLQNDIGDHVRFMRCTQEGEPQNECTVKQSIDIELPNGDTKLEKLCRQYIATRILTL